MIALDPESALPPNVLPFSQFSINAKRIIPRLNAALRVNALHATVLRRLTDKSVAHIRLPDTDPLRDATILLIGRGATYPALSVALGEQMGIVGALSIEAAAKHLNARDLDGIIIGEGFSARVVEAFLTVLSEDARFRNLPIILTGAAVSLAGYDLPNLEMIFGEIDHITANAIPLIRQHAFETRLHRTLKSIDANGLLDPHTGLLTNDAFGRDFNAAIGEASTNGSGLSVAMFSFDSASERIRFDAARILSRLMRRSDFATLDSDNSIIVVFAGANLREAQMITRRFASVLKYTKLTVGHEQRFEPRIMVGSLLPQDTAQTFLERLRKNERRAAAS